MLNKIIIGIDFDGTCVTHEFPKIGMEIGASYVLKKMADNKCVFVLNTMRSGVQLQEAVAWFEKKGIPLYGINNTPGQDKWTQSPKVYAHIYIDDAGIGCPLIKPYHAFHSSGRPFVDWFAMINLLKEKQVLPPNFALDAESEAAMKQEILFAMEPINFYQDIWKET